MAPHDEWPISGRQEIDVCPVCGDKRRALYYSGLRDCTFSCAPGAWDLQRCLSCRTAYLSPRPTESTMHLAYNNYYTHSRTEQLPAEQLDGARWLQRCLANGYKNWRFGAALHPASFLGVAAAYMLPSRRAIIDRQYHHLPRAGAESRVLDIGFGDADFLLKARAIGWSVTGVDTDPNVVENARRLGLTVHVGPLESLHLEDASYDVITLNHVIEHLHEPVATLRECYRVLKPGGSIWLETPNIDGLGHKRFKRHWRGLEVPRHLVIFNQSSLRRALKGVGFRRLCNVRQAGVAFGVFGASYRIQAGLDPHVSSPLPTRIYIAIAVAHAMQHVFSSQREFLAMTAIKPLR